MSRIIVFVGPSLGVEQARALIDAEFRPPCRMGDVYAAVACAPRAIVIIDGYFERTPAVWHKEILHALAQGIAVFGGASMGALRAAELQAFGMIGVGRIYRDYVEEVLEDDDEVAVSHLPAEAGYACRSEAMVNLRYGLQLAAAEGVIDASSARALLEHAKREYYPQRSWRALFDVAPALGIDGERLAALRAFIETRQPDLKRDDAVMLLEAVRQWAQQQRPVAAAPFQFEPTIFWEHLCAYFATSRTAASGDDRVVSVPLERVIHHLRLVGPQRERLRERALLLFLAEQEARRLALGRAAPKAALARFRSERGLNSAQKLSEWMARERVGQDECLALADIEDTLRTLQWRYAEQISQRLPRVLKLDGAYGEAIERIEDKWRRLHALGIDTPSERDVESTEALLDWYQHRFGAVHCELTQHIVELGFGSPRQFVSELAAEYLAEQLRMRSEAGEHCHGT